MAAEAANIMEAVCEYVTSRVRNGEFFLTSHELEHAGLKYVERVIGQTANPSTVSRKWRLLKVDADAYAHHPLMFSEPFVTVQTLKKTTEGTWRIVNINGTPVEAIHGAAKAQLELFERK